MLYRSNHMDTDRRTQAEFEHSYCSSTAMYKHTVYIHMFLHYCKLAHTSTEASLKHK